MAYPLTEERERSAGEILRDLARDLQELLRSEVRLAKAEVGEQVDRAKGAAGMIGGAAVAGLMAGMCIVATCIAALALVMPVWLAALIMGVLLGAAAALMFTIGRSRF